MAGGFAVTKEPGTDLFARRFQAAGYSVLAFDYRGLGESSGKPRQVVRIEEQLADWHAALSCAAKLPGVDPTRMAIWGFSLSGGHVVRVAARDPRVSAAIAQSPNLDGPAVARNAARYQQPLALLRLLASAVGDALGGIFGRRPLMVPLVGSPGTVAVVTTPDGLQTDRVLNPDNRYPHWQQVVAARSVLPLSWYRPGRDAPQIRSPTLYVVSTADRTALPEPGLLAAEQTPQGELFLLEGDHYAPFTAEHEQAVEAQTAFLRRHLLQSGPAAQPPT